MGVGGGWGVRSQGAKDAAVLGCAGDGLGRGGHQLAVLRVSVQQQLVGLAGRDGGVSAAEMGGARGDLCSASPVLSGWAPTTQRLGQQKSHPMGTGGGSP